MFLPGFVVLAYLALCNSHPSEPQSWVSTVVELLEKMVRTEALVRDVQEEMARMKKDMDSEIQKTKSDMQNNLNATFRNELLTLTQTEKMVRTEALVRAVQEEMTRMKKDMDLELQKTKGDIQSSLNSTFRNELLTLTQTVNNLRATSRGKQNGNFINLVML